MRRGLKYNRTARLCLRVECRVSRASNTASLPRLLQCTLVAFFFFTALSSIHAQPVTFSTLAGHGGPGAADGVRNAAGFNGLFGVAADSNGNVYVADTANHTIRRITP